MANPVSTIQSTQPATWTKINTPGGGASTSIPFADVLKDAVDEYTDLQQTVDKDGSALALGQADNLTQIQIDSLKAEAALQTTVQLTSRVVNAYKEIMQMNI